jgi:uncharacterized membrane protein HdeD (DUF308 family)
VRALIRERTLPACGVCLPARLGERFAGCETQPAIFGHSQDALKSGLPSKLAIAKTAVMLLETLKRHWWVPVLRGVAAIIFGIMAFVYPGLTVAVLVLLFGAWVLVDGIFRIIGAIGHRSSDPDWGWQLVIGILGIIIGFLTFHAPAITALALVIYIAAWALMIGATEIVAAIRLRREIEGEWFLILMGIVSIIFAIMLLWNPLPGALALVWLIGSYAIVFGVLGIIFGFRLRSLPTLRTS